MGSTKSLLVASCLVVGSLASQSSAVAAAAHRARLRDLGLTKVEIDEIACDSYGNMIYRPNAIDIFQAYVERTKYDRHLDPRSDDQIAESVRRGTKDILSLEDEAAARGLSPGTLPTNEESLLNYNYLCHVIKSKGKDGPYTKEEFGRLHKNGSFTAGTMDPDFLMNCLIAGQEINSEHEFPVDLAIKCDIEKVTHQLIGGEKDFGWIELLDVFLEGYCPNQDCTCTDEKPCVPELDDIAHIEERIRTRYGELTDVATFAAIRRQMVHNFLTEAFDDVLFGAQLKADGEHEDEWMHDLWRVYKIKERCFEFYGTKWGVSEEIIHEEFMKCMSNPELALIKKLQGKVKDQVAVPRLIMETLGVTNLTFPHYALLALREWKRRGHSSGLTDVQITRWAKGTFGLKNRDIQKSLDDIAQQDEHLSVIDEDVTVIAVRQNGTLLGNLAKFFMG